MIVCEKMRAQVSEASCFAMMKVRTECQECERKIGEGRNPGIVNGFKSAPRPKIAPVRPDPPPVAVPTHPKVRTPKGNGKGKAPRVVPSPRPTVFRPAHRSSWKRVAGQPADRLCPNCDFPVTSNSRHCNPCQVTATRWRHDPERLRVEMKEQRRRRKAGEIQRGGPNRKKWRAAA